MCQLSLVYIKKIPNSAKIARSFLIASAHINAPLNSDGFGFYSNDTLLKTDIPGHLITNLGKISSSTDNIIMSHCRKASLNSPVGGKKIGQEYAHPFQVENLVLAHNGSVELKDPPKDMSPYENLIDSQLFLLKLFENYKQVDSVPLAIEETIKLFWGKFAFLIYDIITNNYYVVRGSSANLHYYPLEDSKGNNLGYLVNTDKDDLIKIILLARNYSQLFGLEFVYDEKKVVEIEKNSLHIAGETLEKLDSKFEETAKPIPVQTSYFGYQQNTAMSAGYQDKKDDRLKKFHIQEIRNFLDGFELKIQDLDALFYFSFNKTLLEATESDWESFIINVIRKMYKESKGKRAAWLKSYRFIRREKYTNAKIYGETDLEYPYFLDSRGISHISTVKERIERELNENNHN